MSVERPPERTPWNEVMSGSMSRQCTPKSEKELDVSGRKVLELVNDRFSAAVDY